MDKIKIEYKNNYKIEILPKEKFFIKKYTSNLRTQYCLIGFKKVLSRDNNIWLGDMRCLKSRGDRIMNIGRDQCSTVKQKGDLCSASGPVSITDEDLKYRVFDNLIDAQLLFEVGD